MTQPIRADGDPARPKRDGFVQRQLALFPTLPRTPAAIAAERRRRRGRTSRADAVFRNSLEQFYGNEENFAVHSPAGDAAAHFPDGAYWARCYGWAGYVRRIEGHRAKLYGFSVDENPRSWIAAECGGHDFAVVDDRYIVDGWALNVELCCDRAVLDLRDADDAVTIWRLYGDPGHWLQHFRNVETEEALDAETPEERGRTMRGVALRPPGPGNPMTGGRAEQRRGA
jgi:hypothetical protein